MPINKILLSTLTLCSFSSVAYAGINTQTNQIYVTNLTNYTWYSTSSTDHKGCTVTYKDSGGYEYTENYAVNDKGKSLDEIGPNKNVTFVFTYVESGAQLSSITCTYKAKDTDDKPEFSFTVTMNGTNNHFDTAGTSDVTEGSGYYYFCPYQQNHNLWAAITTGNDSASTTAVNWASTTKLTPGQGQQMAVSLGRQLQHSLGSDSYTAKFDPNTGDYGTFDLTFTKDCADGEICGTPYTEPGASDCSYVNG